MGLTGFREETILGAGLWAQERADSTNAGRTTGCFDAWRSIVAEAS